MTKWIGARCAVEDPDSVEPPGGCLICIDERECVEPPGQRWTTLADLERDGHHGSLREVEPRLFGIKVEPPVGIRLYDNFGGRVGPGAAGRVRRSAERYIGWVRGDHDNLTTVR